jgi:hypothetical protein
MFGYGLIIIWWGLPPIVPRTTGYNERYNAVRLWRDVCPVTYGANIEERVYP